VENPLRVILIFCSLLIAALLLTQLSLGVKWIVKLKIPFFRQA
jgi:hypothetical protein